MKTLAFFLSAFFGTLVGQAQHTEQTYAYQGKAKALTGPVMLANNFGEIQEGFKIPGERMKKTGSTLTLVGGALLIGGIILTSQGETEYDPYTGMTVADDKTLLGAFMITGGVGMMIPGIIFWSKGAKKYNRYMEQQQSLSFKLRGTGAALTYRF